MFRKAVPEDTDAVTRIYDAIHDAEEAGAVTIGWVRGIYPTRETAEAAITANDLFVLEEDGEIVAAARINRIQVPEYADAHWQFDAPEDQVMVLHTLVVSPRHSGKGYGSRFVAFYEDYAVTHGCPYLRMDTNIKNKIARRMYRKLGYTETDIVPSFFNGIAGVELVCLEKNLLGR